MSIVVSTPQEEVGDTPLCGEGLNIHGTTRVCKGL